MRTETISFLLLVPSPRGIFFLFFLLLYFHGCKMKQNIDKRIVSLVAATAASAISS